MRHLIPFLMAIASLAFSCHPASAGALTREKMLPFWDLAQFDAQDLWMIEDGKPVAARRFDEHE